MTIWSPTIGGSKHAVIFISLIVAITIIDSQFINVFYGTNLGTPGNYHLLLYTSLVVAISIIGTLLLIYTKRNDIHPTSSRPLMFRVAHVGTSLVQYTVIAMLAIAVLEAFIVGWWVFLKPLPPGEHTISYNVRVTPTGALTSPGTNPHFADITYKLQVT
jgi:hypothetical protein